MVDLTRDQQDTCGHRGRLNDPLYRVRNILCAGEEHLTDGQQSRPQAAFTAKDEHLEVELAWRWAQHVRAADHQGTPAAGAGYRQEDPRQLRLVPDKQWLETFLGYLTTDGARNGGTETNNGLIEVHRRIGICQGG